MIKIIIRINDGDDDDYDDNDDVNDNVDDNDYIFSM